MKNENIPDCIRFLRFQHNQIGHINTPFTIWANPHDFNSRLWVTIKENELFIVKQYDETRPSSCDISLIYLSLRKLSRNIIMLHKAQGSAPSLWLNANNLINHISKLPISLRVKYASDYHILKKFIHVYETLQVKLSWKGIHEEWKPSIKK